MADKYALEALNNGEIGAAINTTGKSIRVRTISFETSVAYAAGEVVRLFASVNPSEIPIKIEIANDAIAGASDVDVGLYRAEKGAVIDKDIFGDGLSFTSAVALNSAADGMQTVDISKVGADAFYQYAGDTIGSIKSGAYDLALTFNSDVSAVGTVRVNVYTSSSL